MCLVCCNVPSAFDVNGHPADRFSRVPGNEFGEFALLTVSLSFLTRDTPPRTADPYD